MRGVHEAPPYLWTRVRALYGFGVMSVASPPSGFASKDNVTP